MSFGHCFYVSEITETEGQNSTIEQPINIYEQSEVMSKKECVEETFH